MIRFAHPTPFLKWGPYGAIGNVPAYVYHEQPMFFTFFLFFTTKILGLHVAIQQIIYKYHCRYYFFGWRLDVLKASSE